MEAIIQGLGFRAALWIWGFRVVVVVGSGAKGLGGLGFRS